MSTGRWPKVLEALAMRYASSRMATSGKTTLQRHIADGKTLHLAPQDARLRCSATHQPPVL